jgi:predicted GNAT family N-acyltransferase
MFIRDCYIPAHHLRRPRWLGSYDKTALQFLLRERESLTPMGVIRLNPPPILKLARLCVLPAYRQKGYAERLVNAVHDWVISNAKATTQSTGAQPDHTVVWLHAQLPVIRFYEKYVQSSIHLHNQANMPLIFVFNPRLGYACVGDQFNEEGAPHQRMEISLSTKSSAP